MDATIKLKRVETAMVVAQRAMDKALLEEYPIGKSLGVLLNCRQAHPTTVTVVGSGRYGYLRVRLYKPNKWGHHHVCDVHFEKVVAD